MAWLASEARRCDTATLRLVRFRNTRHGAQRDAKRRTYPAYDFGTLDGHMSRYGLAFFCLLDFSIHAYFVRIGRMNCHVLRSREMISHNKQAD